MERGTAQCWPSWRSRRTAPGSLRVGPELINKGAATATLHFAGYAKNQTIAAQEAAETPRPPHRLTASSQPRVGQHTERIAQQLRTML
jgi:hypothetical protein